MEIKSIVCTPCYLVKRKRDAVMRYKLKPIGSDEEFLIDVCGTHKKQLDKLTGQNTEEPPDTNQENVCPKCDRGFGTRRGLSRHMTTMRHGKPPKKEE